MYSNISQLLEVMKSQSELISRQSEQIDSLLNENMEKENMIQNLMFDNENW